MKKIFPVVAKIDQLVSKFTQGQLLKEGDLAPDFEILDQDGMRVALKNYRGQKVVLWFYPKADTPGCTVEVCEFRNLYSDFSKLTAAVLGVSFDEPRANKRFREKHDVPFSLLSDTQREVGIKYGACKKVTDRVASRIGYLIDEQGVIKKTYPSVDAVKFPQVVLADLATLG